MSIPLFEKYRPKRFAEIKGQDNAISKLKAFSYAFAKGYSKKKAILFHGPAGVGKTTLAHALAGELDYEIFELNASDLRNRKKLDEVLKPSSEQKSLFSKSKIILIDEVDGVTATEYGGLSELLVLIEKSKFPIVITCNDIWQQKFSLLRKRVELVALKDLSYENVLDIISEIAKKEQKHIDIEMLKNIAIKSKGDIRAAINDLQSIINTEVGEIGLESIDTRERVEDIFNALKRIFKQKTNKEIIETYDNVEMEIDQIALWLEKNIPQEYQGEELLKAFEAMSKADIFKGRIYRQQHWRFLVYQNFFLTAGISAASKNKSLAFTKYERPTRILKIWMANQKNIRKKSIAEKFATFTHTSKKRAMRDFFLIALILNQKAAKQLDLSEQEEEFLIDYRGAIKVANNLNKLTLNKGI